MSLREKLQEDLKTALRDGDTARRSAIRLVISGVNYADIEKGGAVDDSAVLAIIQKEARQHRESIEAFIKGKREDLVPKEKAELAVLEGYLPRQLTRKEIAEIGARIIVEVGAKGPGDKGKVMGRVMNEVKGKADGREVNEVVSELLAGGA